MKTISTFLMLAVCFANTATGQNANTSLSNLAATSINQTLQPNANNTLDLGTKNLSWKNLYIRGGIYLNGKKMWQYKSGVNTIIGENAGSTGTGGFNTALGTNVLSVNTTGNSNVAIGEYSLQYNTTGSNNTATGYAALINNTTGYDNTANGFQALYNSTTGLGNTAIGKYALFANTTASNNTATGSYSLYANITGFSNTATGSYALPANTIGYNNTATGSYALQYNTTGDGNSAFGTAALTNNTTGQMNCAFGEAALIYNRTGSYNTATSVYALRLNSAGSYNTATGFYALEQNQSGSYNTATGDHALSINTTGYWNTCIGNIANVSTNNLNGASSFGTGAITNADNKIVIGASGIATMVIGGYMPWSNLSDGRFKEQVEENVPGLDFIKKLRPVTYTINVDKLQHHITAQMPDSIARNYYPDANAIASAKKYIQTGFVAQEVETTAKEISYQFDGVNAPKNSTDNYSIAYSQFVPSLVKAVQELDKKTREIDELKKEVEELKKLVQSFVQTKSLTSNNSLLEQNIPNPFSQSTSINYTLPAKFSSAKIIVTDNNGKTIKQFTLSTAGKGSVSIAAGILSSGVYHYALYVDGKMMDSKKMEIIK